MISRGKQLIKPLIGEKKCVELCSSKNIYLRWHSARDNIEWSVCDIFNKMRTTSWWGWCLLERRSAKQRFDQVFFPQFPCLHERDVRSVEEAPRCDGNRKKGRSKPLNLVKILVLMCLENSKSARISQWRAEFLSLSDPPIWILVVLD